jgi:hypothetical protein
MSAPVHHPPVGGLSDSHSPEERAILHNEERTAARVGSAASCLSVQSASTTANHQTGDAGSPGTSAPSPPHAGRPALPPRMPSLNPASTDSPRACMPPQHSRRGSVAVEEDGTDTEYPIGPEEMAELRRKRTQRNPSYAHIFPQESWPGYRPIEEHGLIGNMHTCAVISTDAQVSWYCQ